MYTSEQISEIAARRIDLVGLHEQVQRKADIADRVAGAGVEFLGSLASAHGEFDEAQPLMKRAVVGVQPMIEAHAQQAVRYQAAVEALLPVALSQLEADSSQQ